MWVLIARGIIYDPVLGKLLEDIKEPHQKLHESAKKIIASYRQIHEDLRNTLRIRLVMRKGFNKESPNSLSAIGAFFVLGGYHYRSTQLYSFFSGML